MKKIYALLVIVCISLTAFTQNVYELFPIGSKISTYENTYTWNWEKANGDTVGLTSGTPRFLSPDGETLLTSQMAGEDGKAIGYWFGTNYDPSSGMAMDYWAQCWDNGSSSKIEGLIAWIGKLINNSNSPNSKLELTLYNVAPNQIITNGQQANGEGGGGAPLATVSKSVNDLYSIDTNMGFNYFPLPTAVNVNAKFAIVSNFAALRSFGDVACLFFDAMGNGLKMHYTYLCVNEVSPQMCFSVNYASGGQLDVNVGLFAVIGEGAANINTEEYFQGMQLTCYPNPTTDLINIEYAIKENSETSLQIMSIDGKIVYEYDFGFQTNGSYNHQIDISSFASGTYFVSLNSLGSRLIKKIVK